jgi:hypothetical protein
MEIMKGFNAAQKAHDNQLPPEYYEDEEGDCVHRWKHLGTAKDGTSFYRCSRCSEEGES